MKSDALTKKTKNMEIKKEPLTITVTKINGEDIYTGTMANLPVVVEGKSPNEVKQQAKNLALFYIAYLLKNLSQDEPFQCNY